MAEAQSSARTEPNVRSEQTRRTQLEGPLSCRMPSDNNIARSSAHARSVARRKRRFNLRK
eukprot:3122508-Pyramimonas_sp.AAC.1